ncbi:MAG: M23 family metallopeptidase [Rickettsiales bacterium]|nr:M23 family metallopeptidase [Rickettsiales bacterium]
MSALERFFYDSRYVITVSREGIKSRKVRPIFRLFYFLVCLWVIFTNVFFFFERKNQKFRLAEIDRLRADNLELSDRMAEIDGTIREFGDYFRTLNYYDRFDRFRTEKFLEYGKNKRVRKRIMAREGVHSGMELTLASVEEDLSLVNQAMKLRADSIGNTLKLASLDRKVTEVGGDQRNGGLNSVIRWSIRRLNSFESFLNSIPIVRPMDSYRVSSRYGVRLDPFDGVSRMHSGIDLVGPYKSKIFVPADGVVKSVSRNGKFGNTVIIDHGNDIVTRYGHLGEIYVSGGDRVRKGDVLAVQGNTGRSTGNHLHYEISVNNVKQDPSTFFQIGDRLGVQLDFGGSSGENYSNSVSH